MRTIRLVLCGVGGVGRNMVRVSRERPGIAIVAAYSRDPKLLGQDVGELAGGDPTGVRVTERAEALSTPAHALLIASTSFLRDVETDIRSGIDAGLDVICTAEEMAYPWEVDRATADSLDAAARAAGVTVIGAGANPGYIYEVVGLALTGAVWRVDRIAVRRVVDLSGFSAGVQRRLGIGFDPATFSEKVRDHLVFGHIGFPHTIRTFGHRLGVTVERIEETVEPILADHPITSTAVAVAPGESAGLHQRTTGIVAGEPWFSAEFIGHVEPAAAGLEPKDSYEIDGLPNVRAVVSPGFNPQWTTAGALANILPLVIDARPGLISVTDLPIPTPWT
ncbi:MAG TPA: NADP-binding protein [Candidatus Eisenbacteria bacterium]|nr:NADP-binding protein [Candidatus Eisenbacteria bacterium]